LLSKETITLSVKILLQWGVVISRWVSETATGARRAARWCEGFYPIFRDPYADPARYAALQDINRREGERHGRDLSQFALIGVASARLTSSEEPQARAKPLPIGTGDWNTAL